MIKKFAIVFVVVSLLVTSAVLADNGANQSTSEYIFAIGENNDGEITIIAQREPDYVYLVTYGFDFFCTAENPVFSIEVKNNARVGAIEIDTSTLDYCDGTPPPMISAECTSNGDFSQHLIGQTQERLSDGGTKKGHTNEWTENADCTITADGVFYEQHSIYYSVFSYQRTVDKQEEPQL